MSGSRHFVASLWGAASIVVLAAFSLSPSQSGAPPKRTGAPGDGTGGPGNSGTCVDVGCHNSFALNSGSGTVSISAPSTYTPGETVAITVTVSQTGAANFGFEITAVDAAGEYQGSWVLGPNTRKTIGNSHYVTHSVTTESEWTFGWQSPSVPVDVMFYAAGNAGDGKLDADGDYIYTTSRPITTGTASGIEAGDGEHPFEILSAYPNPVHDRTTVRLQLDSPEDVVLRVYRIDGKAVLTREFGSVTSGLHEFALDLTDVASGIYLVEATAGATRDSRLLTVINPR